MIDREEPKLSLVRQCALLGISRSSLYYLPTEAGAEDLELMALIDQQYLKTPFYGSRRMTAWLSNHGHQVNRKRVRRLMQLIGLEAIYRRPNTSKPNPGHKVYPYLLRGLEINRVNQVWATDITYIPMARGFLYLVAIMDWHSRYVLAWRLSNTLEVDFCVAALEEALSKGRPQIFNTDQGSQFTSEAFTSMLLAQAVQVSMDGRGRCMDNVFVERLWRSIKYEEEIRQRVDTAMANSTTCLLATASAAAEPGIGFKGSMMVFDDGHLAYWERTRRGRLEHIEENPKVMVYYADPRARVHWRFHGVATVYKSGPIREQIMARTIQAELDRDPERKGYGVLIRVDKITNLAGQALQQRD